MALAYLCLSLYALASFEWQPAVHAALRPYSGLFLLGAVVFTVWGTIWQVTDPEGSVEVALRNRKITNQLKGPLTEKERTAIRLCYTDGPQHFITDVNLEAAAHHLVDISVFHILPIPSVPPPFNRLFDLTWTVRVYLQRYASVRGQIFGGQL